MLRQITLALLGMLLMSAMPVLGQDNGGGQGGPGGDGGPPDFAQMRQRMEERLKERLGATDDEWSVLRDKIETVRQLQRELHPRPNFGPGGPGGPGGPDGNAGPGNGGPGDGGGPNGNPQGGPGGSNPDARTGPDGGGPGNGPGGGPGNMQPGGPGGPDASNDNSPVQKAVDELNKVLSSDDAKPDDIKAAVTKVRDERAKVKADLVKAQTDLQSLVSSKQEAILLTMGVLE